jgi:hypothetical protein
VSTVPKNGFLLIMVAFEHADTREHDAMLNATQAFEIAEDSETPTSRLWPSSSREARTSPVERSRPV